MVVTCLSVIVFFIRDRDGENLWNRLIAPALAGIALGTIAYLVIQQYEVLLGTAPTDPAVWAFPLAYGIVAALGVLLALGLKVYRPQTYQAIGRGSGSDA
jgi:hypothetical protein